MRDSFRQTRAFDTAGARSSLLRMNGKPTAHTATLDYCVQKQICGLFLFEMFSTFWIFFSIYDGDFWQQNQIAHRTLFALSTDEAKRAAAGGPAFDSDLLQSCCYMRITMYAVVVLLLPEHGSLLIKYTTIIPRLIIITSRQS